MHEKSDAGVQVGGYGPEGGVADAAVARGGVGVLQWIRTCTSGTRVRTLR